MKKKECPSCAMEVDAKAKECPVCKYEFPRQSRVFQAIALLLILAFLYLMIF